MRRIVIALALAASGGCSASSTAQSDTSAGSGSTSTGSGSSTAMTMGSTSNDPASTGSGGTTGPGFGPWSCGEPQMCGGVEIRVATYNVAELGFPGSGAYAALAQVIRRVDADIICLQEVTDAEPVALQTLAMDTGYTDVVLAEFTSFLSGDLANACLSRFPIVESRSHHSPDLSGDSSANDMGRDILAARVEISAGCHAAMFVVHLKAGPGSTNEFRRQVEAERLRMALQGHRADCPSDAAFVMGDFNDEVDEVVSVTFNGLPPDLPQSYELGPDIGFPLQYDPFATVRSEDFELTGPTAEDSAFAGTRAPSFRRLDYIMFRDVTLDGDEVYNACEDNGVDDDPPGNWLPKAGMPLPCDTTGDASDHFPVFADFTL